METIPRTIGVDHSAPGHWLDGPAIGAVLRALQQLQHGSLTLSWPGGRTSIHADPGPEAALHVHDRRFFRRLLSGGEIAVGESYMDGEWSSPDLVGLIALMLANRDVWTQTPSLLTWPSRISDTVRHWRRSNSRRGSRRNIAEHYDLSNEFFSLFLDRSLMYSSALYLSPDDSLERAQRNKLFTICDRLRLSPDDHVLEIGTGWGAFAVFAAQHYGCRVTTTTISQQQYAYAQQRIAAAGLTTQIDLRRQDYRDLQGRFDKIVSIEMFEAVGLQHYDAFFSACDRLLTPSGSMLLQTITVDDWRFDDYRSTPSWIAKYIFPGSELASVSRILASLARTSTLSLSSIHQIGPHYAPTLREWRRRFHAGIHEVRRMGFDDRFIRMWDLYLAYCEAAFAAHHIGNAQLVFAKPGARTFLAKEIAWGV